MSWFKRSPRDAAGDIVVIKSRDEFSYKYRGFTVKLTPTGLKYSRSIGRYGAHARGLTHSQSMSLPYELNDYAFGNDIGKTCEKVERNLDKIITFLDLDRAHTAESMQRIAEFATGDRRF